MVATRNSGEGGEKELLPEEWLSIKEATFFEYFQCLINVQISPAIVNVKGIKFIAGIIKYA